ncbi:hypothetical protein CEK28_18495 [Xenophilus sp. AP218F]|nr:hypothetical protein CEK28_18495 [Xenophilus sp. AP218F]
MWIWGTLKGDFEEDRSIGQVGTDMVISLIPGVGVATTLRDLVANLIKLYKNPKDKLILLFIALALIGLIPEAGTVVKGVVRILFVYLRRFVKDAAELSNATKLAQATTKAVDAALPKIIEFLQDSRLVRWATDSKVPNLIRFAGTELTKLADKIDAAQLRKAFAAATEQLQTLLKRIHGIVPARAADQIDEFLAILDKVRKPVLDGMQSAVQPLKTVLKTAGKRLEDHALIVDSRTVNRGWLAPMSQKSSVMLIEKDPPKWVRKTVDGIVPHPAPTLNEAGAMAEELKKISAAKGNVLPELSPGQVQTFEKGKIRAAAIKGPAKLYRVVDPTSGGGGTFWVSEETFNQLKTRAEWREKLAVWPHWNQNGQYVVYELKPGETVYAWKGPAASQQIDGCPYHLPGGGEQILFYPQGDTFKKTLPNIDPTTGEAISAGGRVDTRVNFKDVLGEEVRVGLRDTINDPHIKGPYATNWGFSDWTAEEAARIVIEIPKHLDKQ